MDIYVFNNNLQIVGIIDTFISVIWTSRYYTSGDFELYVSATAEMLNIVKANYYLVRDKDINGSVMHNVMIVKNIELKTDPDNGNTLTITGKSLKSIVGQRVIANQTSLKGSLKDCFNLLLIENLIYPSMTGRTIQNFSTTVNDIIAETVELQLTGDNLEDFFSTICEKYNIGWDIYISNGTFVFELYKGTDRSYNQSENPYIVFSSEFDNLINSDYQYLTDEFKNVAVVAGEGEGAAKTTVTVGTATGLNRYEVYVDASSASSNEGNIGSAEYAEMLQNKGTEALTEYVNNELLDCETDTTTQYILNRDFFLGDVVQIKNDFGITATARILEIIESEDDSGTAVIPTFSTMEV